MKVAIIYPYFAHYREPIINLLSQSKEIDYYFMAGVKPSPEFVDLKLMEFPSKNKFKALRTTWFFKYFSFQHGLLNAIKSGNFDAVIIYADWKFISTWFALIYLKIMRKPVLFWSHGFRKNKSSINDFIKNRYFNLYDGGFVFDQRAKDVFKAKKYTKEIKIVYNSLDYEKQLDVFQKIKLNNENDTLFKDFKPYVVFSGRLTESKNINVLLQAVKQLKDEGKHVNVLLIGDGTFKQNLQNLSKTMNISNQVRFFGSCYDETKLALSFMNAVACVIPSAVGLSAVHALTYGCPVITDNHNIKHGPEVESVVENFTGKYYETGNISSLASKINFFLDLSEKDRIFFRNNAIEIIKNKFNPEFQKKVFNQTLMQMRDRKSF